MIYIIANLELTRQHSRIDLRARRKSKDGRVMLNAKDLDSISGTYEDKLILISAEEISESEAISELDKKELEMNTVQGQVVIKRTRYGDTITVRLEWDKALYQAISDGGGVIQPDWTVSANQPTITPVITSSVKTGFISIKPGSALWKYNHQVLLFNAGGVSTGVVGGGTTGAGLFQINTTTGSLKIIGNLASQQNTNVDTLRFEAVVNTGYETPVGADVDVRIELVGKNSYTGVVDSTSKTLREGEVETVTATARLTLGITSVSDFKTEWLKGATIFKAKSTSKTCAITRADVSGAQLFVCNFYMTIDGADKLVSTYMFVIYDSSDPYFVSLSPLSNAEVSDANPSSTWIAKLFRRSDNVQITTGITWGFQAYNCRAQEINSCNSTLQLLNYSNNSRQR